jgi:NAD(P)-dependent dehydrogenase (short-subunit alcohol dehydrogenase family)
MAAYNATKAAVISLSGTLAGEFADTHIQVSCAMPGFFRSNLLATLRAPGTERGVARRLLEQSPHSAIEAGHAILSGAANGKFYIIWPREYSLFWRLKRLSPLLFLRETQKLAKTQLAE